MNRTEAKNTIAPLLTEAHANALAAETDKLIWIEDNIFPLAGINSSICSDFGETLAEWIEMELEA